MTKPAATPRTTEQQFSVGHLHRHLNRLALSLSDLAEEVDRIDRSVDRVPSPGYASYSERAADVLHAIAVWHMNAHLEQITLYAAQADMNRVEGK